MTYSHPFGISSYESNDEFKVESSYEYIDDSKNNLNDNAITGSRSGIIAEININNTTFQLHIDNNNVILSNPTMDRDAIFPITMSVSAIINNYFNLIIVDHINMPTSHMDLCRRPISQIPLHQMPVYNIIIN